MFALVWRNFLDLFTTSRRHSKRSYPPMHNFMKILPIAAEILNEYQTT